MALAAVLGGLYWKARRDPATPFLPARAGASWIVYPTAPATLPQVAVEMQTVFRRTFVLERQPAAAALRVCLNLRGSVLVNGERVFTGRSDASWKTPTKVAVERFLRAGENTLEVRAANDFGPPGVWLSLDSPAFRLGTGADWQASLAGAASRPARLASTPMDEWRSRPQSDAAVNPPPLAALRATSPLLVLFALLALPGLWAFCAWSRRRAPGPLRSREGLVILLALAALWGAMFWNNRQLSARWGFDSQGHLEYLRAVLEDRRLPLADQGWEMFQPPLYYVLAAGLLRLTGHLTLEESSLAWLHGLGLAIGLLQCAAILAGLRIWFAERLRPLFVGLVVAIFLPVQLYIFQYISNEGLNAALCSLALVVALGILRRHDVGARSHLLLGGVLGLAMLAKFSALVTCGAVLTVLTGALLARGVRESRIYARTVGAAALTALVVSGWHYARVWRHFGRPLIGNFDRAAGFAWWMDPGYATAGGFLRFGRSLTAPLFSALHGLPDALYSTFWGDGMLGGAALIGVRPPWNYGLMAAGFLLALLPTAALLTGLGAELGELARRPSAEALLLLGALGGNVLAVVVLNLALPYYGHGKAFYGLASMVPLCVLAGRGFEILAGERRRLLASGLAILLGVWAVNAYTTFWIRGGGTGEPSAETIAALDPEGLLQGAATAQREGQWDTASALLRRATTVAPDHPFAWIELGRALTRAGDTPGAIAAFREALRVTPRDAQIHAHIAELYAAQGETDRARQHRDYAERLDAAYPTPWAKASAAASARPQANSQQPSTQLPGR